MSINSNECILKLDHLVFDRVSFLRKGFKGNGELSLQFSTGVQKRESDEYVVSLRIFGTKTDEYEIDIRASGFFNVEQSEFDAETLIHQNAVAIIFPYLRSEVTLLTAQPGVDPVVLPPINVVQLVEDAKKAELENRAE